MTSGDVIKGQQARRESENKLPLGGKYGIELAPVWPADVNAGLCGSQLDHFAVHGDAYSH
jgi:hypothetical protein